MTDFLSLSFLCHHFCHSTFNPDAYSSYQFFFLVLEREEPTTQLMIMKHSFFAIFLINIPYDVHGQDL